jgi:hypothetical protein
VATHGVACSAHEPVPEVMCRLLFKLVFKGCPKGSLEALNILKLAIDAPCQPRFDASCLTPSKHQRSSKLLTCLSWVPSDDEFLQVRRFPSSFPSVCLRLPQCVAILVQCVAADTYADSAALASLEKHTSSVQGNYLYLSRPKALVDSDACCRCLRHLFAPVALMHVHNSYLTGNGMQQNKNAEGLTYFDALTFNWC